MAILESSVTTSQGDLIHGVPRKLLLSTVSKDSMPSFQTRDFNFVGTLAERWKPEKVNRNLCFIGNEDWEGKRVLDIGAGEGLFVRYLMDHGAEAEGIDVQIENAENNVKEGSSFDLDHANNYFDVVLSNWGGLAYPVRMSAREDEEDILRDRVLALLVSIVEAVRVSKDEVRVYPWTQGPFGEEFGLMTFGLFSGTDNVLAIDFSDLFESMGLKYEYIESESKMAYKMEPKFQALVLKNCGEADFSGIYNLISYIMRTDNNLFVKFSESTDLDFQDLVISIRSSAELEDFYKSLGEYVEDDSVHTDEFEVREFTHLLTLLRNLNMAEDIINIPDTISERKGIIQKGMDSVQLWLDELGEKEKKLIQKYKRSGLPFPVLQASNLTTRKKAVA